MNAFYRGVPALLTLATAGVCETKSSLRSSDLKLKGVRELLARVASVRAWRELLAY